MALVLDDEVTAARILETVREVAGELLVNLRLFDVYRGQHIENGKKSVAVGVVLQHRERTLTDEEVHKAHQRVISHLGAKFSLQLRQ